MAIATRSSRVVAVSSTAIAVVWSVMHQLLVTTRVITTYITTGSMVVVAVVTAVSMVAMMASAMVTVATSTL